MAPPQTIQSSYTWGGLFDLMKRLGAKSVFVSPADELQIVRKVSAFAYTRYPWPFTLGTTPTGSIQAIDGQQDYAQPPDVRAITRAWLYVPTNQNGTNYGNVPPYDDPNLLALQTAMASAQYVGALHGGSYPKATIWPPTGSLDVVKRLPVNLYPRAYTGIREITQQPNQGLIRLSSATAVPFNQQYSIELEYQLVRPPVNALTETCWFPDDYVAIGQEGILYELYRFNNDARAGTASFSADGSVSYSGQLAVWMGALESSAAAEREGSVNFLTPTSSIGADWGASGWWFA